MFLHQKYSEKVATQHLHGAYDHGNNYTYNYCSKHESLAQLHLFRPVLAEHKCNDDSGKNNDTYQQEYEYPLAKLLTAHPFDTEVKFWGNFWAYLRDSGDSRIWIGDLNR